MWILESQTDLLDDFRDFRKAMSVVFVLMFVYIRARLMLIALALNHFMHLLIFRQMGKMTIFLWIWVSKQFAMISIIFMTFENR